jgi:AcrR family transcriptional regulator
MPQAGRTKRKPKRVSRTAGDRRREILDVTVKLLAEHGIQGTSVSRIADAVGMSKGTLYYHFPNHKALLSAAMDLIDETATDWITKPSGDDALSRLLAIGKAHSRWTLSARNTFLRPFYQTISSNLDDDIAAAIGAKRRIYLDRLAEYAEEGKREGTIRSDADAREIGYCLLMHAWAEDIAFLMGDDDYITEGFSHKMLRRLLAAYAAPNQAAPDEASDKMDT